MKHLLLTTIAAVVMLLFGRVNEVNADPLTYEVVGDTVTIKDCKETASGVLAIPFSYDGKPVTRIEEDAFYGCSSLTSVTVPDSVTSIGNKAFAGCSSLTSVTISDSVTRVGEWAFEGCSSLTSVTIGDRVTSILWGAFAGCSSLTGVTIPDSVTHLAWGAFEGCRGLTSLTIPDSVSSIGSWAFSGCSSLTSVIIGNNVTSIGRWAFEGCHSLTNVSISSSVIRIGSVAFRDCSSLKSITFEGNAPSSLGADVFKYLPIGATISVPVGATGFGETFGGLPVIIQGELEINTFSKSASPFTISFESKSDSTYTIEVTQDFKQWSEIGEVQGTGSSVKFTDPRLPIVPFERNYFRVELVE